MLGVISGKLVPVAHCSEIPGIGGYLLSRIEVEMSAQAVHGTHEDGPCLTVAQTARYLAIEMSRVIALIESNHLSVACVYQSRTGVHRMIKLSDVEEFAGRYESVALLAKRTGSSAKYLIARLRERNVQLLSIPFARPGNHLIFVPRQISNMIRGPLPRLSEDTEQTQLDRLLVA
jgi:hypothetical protein